MATGTITDKINDVVALLIDQCNCGTPSEIKAAFQELQAALNAQLAAVTTILRRCRSDKSDRDPKEESLSNAYPGGPPKPRTSKPAEQNPEGALGALRER